MPKQSLQAGFTLLELMLAMFIGSVVILILGLALRLNIKSFDVYRTDTEEAQLARVLMGMIADDLRRSVHPTPQDVSSVDFTDRMPSTAAEDALEEAADSESDSTGTASSASASTEGATTGDESSTNGGAGGGFASSSDTEEASDSSYVLPIIGLYGSQYDIQVDVARTPRADQYLAYLSNPDAGMSSQVTGLKSITYFVQTSNNALPNTGLYQASEPGLYRMEVDRAASAWAISQGITDIYGQEVEFLAPEVVALEFFYFDGTDWNTDWDMATRNALPVAVEIQLTIQRSSQIPTDSMSSSNTPQSGSGDVLIYRDIVYLIGGKPSSIIDTESADEEEESTGDGFSTPETSEETR